MTIRSWLSWPAFPGPVFRRELGSAARGSAVFTWSGRWRRGSWRGTSVRAPRSERPRRVGEWSPGVLAGLATRAFREFLASQFALVLAMWSRRSSPGRWPRRRRGGRLA